MQRNLKWMAGVFVLVLGLAPGLQASVCDEDPPYPYPMKFRPVLIVGPLVDLLMDWYLSEVGGAFPEEMDVEYYLDPEDPDNFNFYGHTLILHMSEVEGELTESTLQITPEVGLVTVRINIPALSSHVDIIDVVNEESCGLDVFCQIENGIFDLLPGMDLGMTIDESSSYIAQTAEVCVLPGCAVAYPLLDTTVNLDGVSTQIIEESDVPQWIWDLDIFNIIRGIVNGINTLVDNMMYPMMIGNMTEDIYELLVDEDTGKGTLIELISFDIQYDGIRPPHEVMNCTGAACSSLPHSSDPKGRPLSLILYALPAVILAGVILLSGCAQSQPAGETGGAAIDGEALLQDRCTQCHTLDRVMNKSESADWWEQVVTNMVGKGAVLNADEQTALVEYLSATYGP